MSLFCNLRWIFPNKICSNPFNIEPSLKYIQTKVRRALTRINWNSLDHLTAKLRIHERIALSFLIFGALVSISITYENYQKSIQFRHRKAVSHIYNFFACLFHNKHKTCNMSQYQGIYGRNIQANVTLKCSSGIFNHFTRWSNGLQNSYETDMQKTKPREPNRRRTWMYIVRM